MRPHRRVDRVGGMGLALVVAFAAVGPLAHGGDVCGASDRSCFRIHTEPGCDDAACCALVCAEDPFCCDTEWDYLCRQSAVERCAPPVPSNDEPSGARLVTGPLVVFSTIGATDSADPTIPADCGGVFGDEIRRDVWFVLRAPVTGTLGITTCPYEGAGSFSEFDTILLLRDPETLEILACNDESSACGGFAELVVPVQAGERLLLQLGGHDEFVGFGAFEIAANGKPARAPANDACKSPAPLGLPASQAFDLLGAAPSSSTCDAPLADAWWVVDPAPGDGVVRVGACSGEATTVVEVRRLCGDDGVCAMATGCEAGEVIESAVVAGESLLVRVASLPGAQGTLTCEFEPAPDCLGDFNGDGRVDAVDLGTVLGFWGEPGGDLNGDGFTNALDLGIVLGAWGFCR
jgi:hypothetical protein